MSTPPIIADEVVASEGYERSGSRFSDRWYTHDQHVVDYHAGATMQSSAVANPNYVENEGQY